MHEWQVKELFVDALTYTRGEIVTYGVNVDGCASETVLPHIKAVASDMNLIFSGFRLGSTSPFFTVLDCPSKRKPEDMAEFMRRLAARDIRGPYCPDNKRELVTSHFIPARIFDLQWHHGVQCVVTVKVTSTAKVAAGLQLRKIPGRCSMIEVGNSGTMVTFHIVATDDDMLARRLRLAANLCHLRWDRNDERTLALLGEPLV